MQAGNDGNTDAAGLDGEDLVDGRIGIEALEFRAHLVKEQHIHLMIDETVHLEDASRFNDTFLANPFFQQLHVIQPLFSLFGEIPVRGR